MTRKKKRKTEISQAVIVLTLIDEKTLDIRSLNSDTPDCPMKKMAESVLVLFRDMFANPDKWGMEETEFVLMDADIVLPCPLCQDAGEIVDDGDKVGDCPRCGGGA